jgi:hypothetical protein
MPCWHMGGGVMEIGALIIINPGNVYHCWTTMVRNCSFWKTYAYGVPIQAWLQYGGRISGKRAYFVDTRMYATVRVLFQMQTFGCGWIAETALLCLPGKKLKLAIKERERENANVSHKRANEIAQTVNARDSLNPNQTHTPRRWLPARHASVSYIVGRMLGAVRGTAAVCMA